jgi:hypothetical protein
MDASSKIPSYTQEDEASPPSYTDTISSFHSTASSSTSQYYSSQIQSQLATLTTQILSFQTQKDILSHAQDERVLSLLTYHIQLYLSDFAKAGLPKGSLILVPAKAVQDPNAIPTDYDFRDSNEYDRVVKISDKENEGNELWYWDDENMAMRLAGYLRPTRDPRTLELPKGKEQMSPQPQAKGWGLFKKKKTAKEPQLVEEGRAIMVQDQVNIDVKAEEIVFRFENEYGMYVSESGWGIVVKLRVVMGMK